MAVTISLRVYGQRDALLKRPMPRGEAVVLEFLFLAAGCSLLQTGLSQQDCETLPGSWLRGEHEMSELFLQVLVQRTQEKMSLD